LNNDDYIGEREVRSERETGGHIDVVGVHADDSVYTCVPEVG
jgi:hypothetical protein